jgi:PAS domain S-box-containing protein
MNRKLEILHLEDDPDDAEIIQRQFKAEHLAAQVTCVRTREQYETALAIGGFDLIISDYSMPGFDGLSALKMARERYPMTPFIFASGTIGEERAVEALKLGATDYVIKDRPARLVQAVERAMESAAAARERIRDAEKIHEQAMLLDRAQDAICLFDMAHTILYWNSSAVRLYGWTTAEALGRNANELLFRDDRAAHVAALKSIISKGDWQGQLQQVTRDGRQIIVESRWSLVRGRGGEPKSMLVINSDITEKKQIEAQLLRTQRMDSIGALAGGIAHDLNNCLTPVMLGIALLEQESPSPAAAKMLEIMRASTQRGVDMVRQILTFARGAGGDRTVLQLGPLIKDMTRLAEETFPRSVNIESTVGPNLAAVTGNATQLSQVLLNLCVNARDAMPEGGHLRIAAETVVLDEASARSRQLPPGLHVRLSVRDTGHGMPPRVLEKIFEPFFTTKDHGKGTGLGLSTVMGIVKTHGGSIEAESETGRGTTLTVYLPAAQQAVCFADDHRRPEVPKGHGELVLLVDDEAAVLEVTRLLLESFGYNVVTAHNGEEALAIYRQDPAGFDVVVTDMMMPTMNGEETITALRQMDPTVKVVGISGLGPNTPLVSAGQTLGNAFLRKPFTTTDLLGTLHRVLPVNAST